MLLDLLFLVLTPLILFVWGWAGVESYQSIEFLWIITSNVSAFALGAFLNYMFFYALLASV